MKLFINIIIIISLLVETIISVDVCANKQCKCTKDSANVNCDSKGWTTLNTVEFPSNVRTLTLVNNKLSFNTIDDLMKIDNLTSLIDLSLNQNPLGTIPPFNDSKIRSISLQDTSLLSAEFPSSYLNSFLETISLSNNKIHSIDENNFLNLKNSKVKKLHMDSASLTVIHQNAFIPLIRLQSLSLKYNQLKSCEFLSTLSLLSSIKLDGNQFTSLPQELSIPKNIKHFFFTQNLITIIDESSPLHTWLQMKYTNIKIYLANNSFDCCQSLWFIRFLNTSSYFVGDASLLTCATPSNYAGKQLIKLNPDEMDCGGVLPNRKWWTTGRIIAVVIGGSASILALIIVITIIITTRRQHSRSGYTEIGGIDDPSSSDPLLPSRELPFPPHGEDDDAVSTYSSAPTINTVRTHVRSNLTAGGISANDEN
ncbi:unnamed protein product [Rotaria sp. Silwood2]|nr:unnamed protein product [Rotaria sp. Silwood2]CAF2543132.1 unnamed protein product [Rotaria sp. Silwood2]CAF2779728.1 unnamed protein product [Rotaria sp. Silwood2]CAF2953961.1 unnamed protein product [Rotaria sp. Silwood2]CAF3948151.1 unnamed protein product [Rotaria sp. Silwood2]